VAGSLKKPVVLERCRIETADPSIPGSKQPYHAAERLDAQKAETLIELCRDSSILLAKHSVSALVAQITGQGYRVVGSGILFASGRLLPDLAATLESHALIHTAEGQFFREALVSASKHCSLPVTRIKERETWDRGASVFHLDPADLRLRIMELGRSLGPPWREDQKLAALAAWIALAESDNRSS